MPDEIVKSSIGIDKEKISENKIAYVVETLQGISLLENENVDEGDVLGDFFEGIVSDSRLSKSIVVQRFLASNFPKLKEVKKCGQS